MISFKEYTAENLSDAPSKIALMADGADVEYLTEITDSFSSLCEDDVRVAFSYVSGCLLVRIFDMGRYLFVYPIPVSDESDEDEAVDAVRLYAVKEELPLTFCDVPAESIGTLVSHFCHVTADAEDASRASYRVSVMSEVSLVEDIPELFGERISLSTICDTDTAAYAALCRDARVNEYWGYDYLSDVGEVDDSYFVDEAIAEYNRGSALTLGAHLDGEFIGELTLHAFDLLGGCEIAFRLTPDRWGQGLGTELLNLAFETARRIGLTHVYARVKNENVRSDALLMRHMELEESEAGQKKYRKEL